VTAFFQKCSSPYGSLGAESPPNPDSETALYAPFPLSRFASAAPPNGGLLCMRIIIFERIDKIFRQPFL